jgi:predicted nuclease of predicted toxin-antitoxin system
MRVLLDECLPKRLKAGLSGHECQTVPEAGLAGKKNGELLRFAETAFDVFITIDAGILYQQNLSRSRISIVILSAKSNRFVDLESLLPRIIQALETIVPGKVLRVKEILNT